jgi:hypothetical protein
VFPPSHPWPQDLAAALASMPRIGALLFLDRQGQGLQAIREDDGVDGEAVQYHKSPKIMRQIVQS